MLDDFMMRAALASVGVAVMAGPLGCFVVWRRMAYFGDATAHAALLGVALVLAWRRLMNSTISAELATAEGGSPILDRLLLSMVLAVMVAVAMKIVGVLLITAMLIIPAAAARPLSRRPWQMALGAALFGAGAAIGGLEASLHLDTPSGPTIAAATFLFFVAANGAAGLSRFWREGPS